MNNFNYANIVSSLSEEMAQMDQTLARVLDSEHEYLKKLHTRILSTRGKRLRPALLFLCSKMLGYSGKNHIIFASVFELIHTATLIHDDVIDDSETRRGLETIYHGEGTVLSVLFGDLLYTKANTLAIKAGSLEVMGLISSVTEEMIEGELLQEKYSFDLSITEEDYFNILSRKTAFLFGGTAKTAGLTSNLSPEACEDLYQYGFNLGISFQLIDDFLDYTGFQDQMGKPVLSDLLAGKLTLPVIRYLKTHSEIGNPLIQRIWDKKDKDSLGQLADYIRQTPSFNQTFELSKAYAEKAITYLKNFPDNPYKETLLEIPLKMINRKS